MESPGRHDQTRKAPQEPPCFSNITPASIDEQVGSALRASVTLRDQLVASLTPSTATFANLVVPLLDDSNAAACQTVIPGLLLSRVSVDPEVRQAARDAQKRIADAGAKNLQRSDIALLVAAVFEKEKASMELDDEDRSVLAYMNGQFLRSGANIRDESKRRRLGEAQSEISTINATAIKAFTETSNSDGMWLCRTELTGCSEAWLDTLQTEKQNDGIPDRFWIPYEKAGEITQSAQSGTTRKRAVLARQKRFPENIERLSKVAVLRDEIARLLGYEHHATLKMEETMMRSLPRLLERMRSIQAKLVPFAQVEADTLLELKKSTQTGCSQPDVDTKADESFKLYLWDWAYHENMQRKQEFAVDNAKVSEYFEANHVVKEMLKVFEELFGMDFVPMPDLSTWHETVSPFTVWDSPAEGGGFLGYLYLDIFERQGKFTDQYHSRIQPGYFDAHGSRHYPVSALVCSYHESTPGRPSLLTHRDVRILFHELGHAIHHFADRTKYATGQSSDFGEIPSNMLEHFIWIPEVMVRLSKHFTTLPGFRPKDSTINDTHMADARIPLDLARAVAKTKSLNQASGLLGLMQPALFDLEIYSPKSHEYAMSMDLTAMWNDSRHQCLLYSHTAESDATFGYAGYSAFFRVSAGGYFTYIMSRVYAADLYQESFSKDPLSPAVGRRWRYEVLEKGSSQPELEVLERFLGRSLSVDAILAQIRSQQRS